VVKSKDHSKDQTQKHNFRMKREIEGEGLEKNQRRTHQLLVCSNLGEADARNPGTEKVYDLDGGP